MREITGRRLRIRRSGRRKFYSSSRGLWRRSSIAVITHQRSLDHTLAAPSPPSKKLAFTSQSTETISHRKGQTRPRQRLVVASIAEVNKNVIEVTKTITEWSIGRRVWKKSAACWISGTCGGPPVGPVVFPWARQTRCTIQCLSRNQCSRCVSPRKTSLPAVCLSKWNHKKSAGRIHNWLLPLSKHLLSRIWAWVTPSSTFTRWRIIVRGWLTLRINRLLRLLWRRITWKDMRGIITIGSRWMWRCRRLTTEIFLRLSTIDNSQPKESVVKLATRTKNCSPRPTTLPRPSRVAPPKNNDTVHANTITTRRFWSKPSLKVSASSMRTASTVILWKCRNVSWQIKVWAPLTLKVLVPSVSALGTENRLEWEGVIVRKRMVETTRSSWMLTGASA